MDAILNKLTESEILGLTMYGEARGETPLGQIAVGCVVRNRTDNSGRSFKDECLKPKQFSCWNENDNNYQTLIEFAKVIIFNDGIQDLILGQCIYLAAGIVNRHICDVTNGATHYLTKLLFEKDPPKWANNPKNVNQFDRQVFFNV